MEPQREPLTDDNIHDAVKLWCDDRKSAEIQYGHISHWDTSAVTNMKDLFRHKNMFNDDISQWNVSNVTTMEAMF